MIKIKFKSGGNSYCLTSWKVGLRQVNLFSTSQKKGGQVSRLEVISR